MKNTYVILTAMFSNAHDIVVADMIKQGYQVSKIPWQDKPLVQSLFMKIRHVVTLCSW